MSVVVAHRFSAKGMLISQAPVRVEGECVAHSCGIFKKEPWPKCCSEASAAFSKGMEARYFQEKLNL